MLIETVKVLSISKNFLNSGKLPITHSMWVHYYFSVAMHMAMKCSNTFSTCNITIELIKIIQIFRTMVVTVKLFLF